MFAVGDAVHMPGEEKLAQNAEIHARLAARNVLAAIDAETSGETASLVTYTSRERMVVISLGPYDGVFLWGPVCLTGFIPAVLKEAVEWKTLCRYW